jgi:5-methylcytosine-specific restriction protein B
MLRLEKIREITAADLGIAPPDSVGSAAPPVAAASDDGALSDDHPLWVAVRDAMLDGYGGAILTGVPGTGKSRMAALLAEKLTDGHTARAPFVQFHASYQYEDFIEGYVPIGEAFSRELKTFALLCLDASGNPGDQYVIVIDEISRADVARVFGEALTYIERSKREKPFKLASGTDLTVPDNLFVLATMNPWDRGADELDTALERRFAFINMPPREEELNDILAANSTAPELTQNVVEFFRYLNNLPNERCHLGHGFFVHVRDLDSLERLWAFQLSYILRRACRDDDAAFEAISKLWRDLFSADPLAAPQA